MTIIIALVAGFVVGKFWDQVVTFIKNIGK